MEEFVGTSRPRPRGGGCGARLSNPPRSDTLPHAMAELPPDPNAPTTQPTPDTSAQLHGGEPPDTEPVMAEPVMATCAAAAVAVPMARPILGATRPAFGACGRWYRGLIEIVAAFIAVNVIASVLYIVFAHRYTDHRWAVAAVAFAQTAAVPLLLGYVRLAGHPLSTVGVRSGSVLVDVILGIALALALIAVIMILSTAAEALVPGLAGNTEQNAQKVQQMIPRMPPRLLLAMAACVALYEELLFRGFFLTRLRPLLRRWWLCVLVSGALFTGMHWYQTGFSQFLIFIVAIALGAMFVVRRSLLPVIVAHFVFDAAQLVRMYLTSPNW